MSPVETAPPGSFLLKVPSKGETMFSDCCRLVGEDTITTSNNNNIPPKMLSRCIISSCFLYKRIYFPNGWSFYGCISNGNCLIAIIAITTHDTIQYHSSSPSPSWSSRWSTSASSSSFSMASFLCPYYQHRLKSMFHPHHQQFTRIDHQSSWIIIHQKSRSQLHQNLPVLLFIHLVLMMSHCYRCKASAQC